MRRPTSPMSRARLLLGAAMLTLGGASQVGSAATQPAAPDVLSAAATEAERQLHQTFTNLKFEEFGPAPVKGPIYQASAGDPKNLNVRAQTSTLPRRSRADVLLARLPARLSPSAVVNDAIAILRDRNGPGDRGLALGDRSAINALIATHGVVMDSLQRVLWVSESPHLLGRFVAFELKRMLAPDYDPEQLAELPASSEDPLLTSGDYARFRAKHE